MNTWPYMFLLFCGHASLLTSSMVGHAIPDNPSLCSQANTTNVWLTNYLTPLRAGVMALWRRANIVLVEDPDTLLSTHIPEFITTHN